MTIPAVSADCAMTDPVGSAGPPSGRARWTDRCARRSRRCEPLIHLRADWRHPHLVDAGLGLWQKPWRLACGLPVRLGDWRSLVVHTSQRRTSPHGRRPSSRRTRKLVGRVWPARRPLAGTSQFLRRHAEDVYVFWTAPAKPAMNSRASDHAANWRTQPQTAAIAGLANIDFETCTGRATPRQGMEDRLRAVRQEVADPL